MKEIHIEILEKLKKEFPSGTRVALVKMDDPYSTLKAGDKGTVTGVDDIVQFMLTGIKEAVLA